MEHLITTDGGGKIKHYATVTRMAADKDMVLTPDLEVKASDDKTRTESFNSMATSWPVAWNRDTGAECVVWDELLRSEQLDTVSMHRFDYIHQFPDPQERAECFEKCLKEKTRT